ncbi:MAG: zinc ribbon domain-containing protein [Chitinispirillales bacterium]|nr:zinc ribbon domain-containing protein [Chitinispirillales bacterium]
MPIYEYKCEKCSNFFEELVTGDRDKKIPCPVCGFSETQKLMSAIGGISMKSGSSVPSCASGGGCGGAMSSCAGGGCPHAGF